ncbi:MAG: proteasome subunit beta [Candidatus Altiarchaeota archaeon]|nr:proteasome subunit beta [Candidatus Altiarchaeota archaeon]
MDIEKQLKTGTTTLGLLYKDGVILAADSQSTSSYVESRYEKKVHPVNKKMALTTAGVVADLQYVLRLMRVESRLHEMGNGNVTTKALVTLLSNVLHSNRYFPYIAAMVIGGYDKEGPHLFSMDPYGGIGRGENFFSTGSGSPLAMGVLESQYTEGLSENEAIELAKTAVNAAIQRDVYSGGKKLTIAVIDKNGYREIE